MRLTMVELFTLGCSTRLGAGKARASSEDREVRALMPFLSPRLTRYPGIRL
jgi:hypothetical protein